MTYKEIQEKMDSIHNQVKDISVVPKEKLKTKEDKEIMRVINLILDATQNLGGYIEELEMDKIVELGDQFPNEKETKV